MSERRSGGCGGSIVTGLLITIIGGVAVWWLTTSPDSPFVEEDQSYLEQVAGNYTLETWDEDWGGNTLYLEILGGNLSIDEGGNAEWQIFLREFGDSSGDFPQLVCEGRVDSADKQMEYRDQANEINWTGGIRSIRSDVYVSLCGEGLPFDLNYEESGDTIFLRMGNSRGTFSWMRPG